MSTTFNLPPGQRLYTGDGYLEPIEYAGQTAPQPETKYVHRPGKWHTFGLSENETSAETWYRFLFVRHGSNEYSGYHMLAINVFLERNASTKSIVKHLYSSEEYPDYLVFNEADIIDRSRGEVYTTKEKFDEQLAAFIKHAQAWQK